jgi:NAD(P)H-flavin reductase
MTLAPSAAVAVNPWLSQTVRIEGITPEVDGVSTYHFRFQNPAVDAAYRFEPGQFNMLYVPGVGEIAIGVSTRREPWVDSNGQTAGDRIGTWDHTVRQAGQVTTALAKIGVGGTIGLRGPYGTAWPIDQAVGKDVILVAGGTGLASLRAAVYSLLDRREQFARVTLLYGGRSPDLLLYASEYDQWERRGLRVETTVDRGDAGWSGHVGVVPQLIDRLQPLAPSRSIIFCCGPEVMVRYTLRSAVARGIGKDRIWVSLERNMQCAVGICGHCQLGPEMICKDGPVFRLDRIEPFLGVEAL